ncbi:MAG: chloride channel protein [Cyanobacteria bacterium K_DeepCast_35m_m2_023]|nr:chloride channel protein [Cyanobacteria bacterium K_DeepCast_35m_m2_023]
MTSSSTPLPPRLKTVVVLVGQLALLGLLVGLACWPLNLVDHWQDLLLRRLPIYQGGRWSLGQAVLACSPLLVMPLLLKLQAVRWQNSAGSGIPQTITSLEDPPQAHTLMAHRPVLQRLLTWSIASLSLFPLGREGPVVQVGAAVAYQLRRRWPRLLERLSAHDMMAMAAGAGLAGGFNTPLMGVVFVAEELTGHFAPQLIWPGLVVCVMAAEVSNLGGQPQFGLGMVQANLLESSQVVWGTLLGVICGLAGGLFAWSLLQTTRWLTPRVRQHPWRWGLVLGGLLAGLAMLSGGASGGDGEALMSWLLSHPEQHRGSLITLAARLLGPCLALGAGIPGGLIDPAFAIGAVLGDAVGQLSNQSVFGVTFGMAAALAGATQLPAMSLVFALRMAGDQQLLPGVAMAAVIGSYVGRLWLHKPIYHALTDLLHDELMHKRE